jgi:hypothetical protein
MSIYIKNPLNYINLAIYDSSGPDGGPGKYLTHTGPFWVQTAGWKTVSVTSVDLPAGNYWLAWIPSGSRISTVFGSDSGSYYSHMTQYGSFPTTFPSGSTVGTGRWSLYATLTSAFPTPTPTPSPTPGAGQKAVAWDAPSAVAGYKVFWGTTSGGPYTNSADAGMNLSYTITGLTSGTTYYVAVESYSSSGVLSCPTNEVTFIAP